MNHTMQQTINIAKAEIEDQNHKLITVTLLREDFAHMVNLAEKELEHESIP